MEYYGNNDWRDYHLAHYGVKGMKKGKHLPGTDWWKDNPISGTLNSVQGRMQNIRKNGLPWGKRNPKIKRTLPSKQWHTAELIRPTSRPTQKNVDKSERIKRIQQLQSKIKRKPDSNKVLKQKVEHWREGSKGRAVAARLESRRAAASTGKERLDRLRKASQLRMGVRNTKRWASNLEGTIARREAKATNKKNYNAFLARNTRAGSKSGSYGAATVNRPRRKIRAT